MATVRSVVVRIGADITQFQRNMQRAGSQMQKIGGKLQGIGKSLSAKLTLPIVGLGAASIKSAADFEKAMSEVKAISGATEKDFESLSEKAKEMGKTTKFSAKQSAEAMKFMAMAGWDATQIIDGLDGVMNLAAASGEDLALVSDIMTDAMTAFGLKAEEATYFADLLAATASNANTNVAMLGESFQYAAPIAGALGISAEDTALALGLMANAGIKASMSGTALRSLMSSLAEAADSNTSVFSKMGVEIAKNADGTINLGKTIGSLREAFEKLSPAQQANMANAISTKPAMAGVLAVINASTEDYNKLTQAITNSTGTAKTMADIMQNNLSGTLTKLMSALEGVSIQIGTILIPIIKDLVDNYISPAVAWFSRLDVSNQKLIVVVGALVAAIGPLVLIVGTLISSFGTVVAAIGAISTPVLVVIGVITALIAVLTTLWQTNEDFKNTVIAAWQLIKTTAIDIWVNTLKPALTEVFEDIKATAIVVFTKLSKFWDEWGASIVSVAKIYWNQLKTSIEFAINLIKDIIGAVLALIRGDWDAFQENIEGVIESIITFIKDSLNNFKPIFETIWKGFKIVVENIWDDIKNKISAVVGWITDKIISILNKIDSVKKAAKEITSGAISKVTSGVTGVVGKAKEFIPKFEKGTNFVPNDGLAYLHKGEAVVPAKFNTGTLGGGVTVNITGNTISSNVDVDVLGTQMISKLRMAGVTR